MISSFIDGRVRIRCDALRNPEAAAAIEGTLRETPGVLSATANPRTGGLLVEYDPDAVTQEQLLEAAKMLEAFAAQEPAAPKKSCCCRRLTKAEAMRISKRGMAGSLAALVLFGLAGRERAHIVAGGLFLAFNAYHLYAYRKRVMA
ncbi:HMA2 domain-containing protein [Nitratidesulfovibrio sp.]|uniref:HMA2 domain-containing protein n=1 Tax=Nitratidesulfovibrio sp. TaxID=2802297 RepID=UPI00333E5FF4